MLCCSGLKVEYSSVQPSTEESQARQKSFPTLKSLLKAHKKREVPKLREEDIEETFIRGPIAILCEPSFSHLDIWS